MNNFIIMDLENNNIDCNSVCSIAFLVVENGEVVREIVSLINPESRFDERNSHINKITEDMVKDAPKINEFYEKEIKDLFSKYTVIGHNAHYDLTVLAKALYSYGVDMGEVKYICTWEMSEIYLPDLKSHKLHHICNDLNFTYNAHDALEDSRACLFLYKYLIENKSASDNEKTFLYRRKKNDKIRGEEY